MPRKVIQIATHGFNERHNDVNDAGVNYFRIVALCDDGTMWEHIDNGKGWYQLPPIPQETPNAS